MIYEYLADLLFEGKHSDIRINVKEGDIPNPSLSIDGYKHSMVQIIALTVALKMKTVIINPPIVSDTYIFVALINELGGIAELRDGRLYLDATTICNSSIPCILGRSIHGSLYLCPALLLALNEFAFFGSGGCQIGDKEDSNNRPISHILSVISQFGAKVIIDEKKISGKRYKDNAMPNHIDIMEYSSSKISLSGPLVGGATKVAIMMSVYKDEFVIKNPYLKTEVYDMIEFLRLLGKKVELKKNSLHLEGIISVPKDRYVEFTLTQCISEIVTYATLAVLTNTKVVFRKLNKKVISQSIKSEISLMKKMGIGVHWINNDLKIEKNREIAGVDINVTPKTIYSDHHPFFALLLLFADKQSTITENVWRDRFMYVDNLLKLGAILQVSNNKIIISPSKLKSICGELPALDVRSAAVTLLAMIISHSTCSLVGAGHIFRGYSHLKENMKLMGVELHYGKS